MDALNYLCREADDFFPYIDVVDCNVMVFKAAIRVLYKSRTSEDQDFGFVRGALHREVENTLFYNEVQDVVAYEAVQSPEGFAPVPAVQILNKHGIKAKGWVHTEKKMGYLVVYTGGANRNCIAAVFPQMTPWKFREKPLTDFEKKFLIALLGNGDSVSDMLQEYIDMMRISQQLQGAKLDKMIAGMLDAKLADARQREQELLERIYDLEKQLRAYNSLYNDVCDTIAGIRINHRNDDLEDFKNAFMSNPNCYLDRVNGTHITFFLTGFVTNFSEHKFESMTASDKSHLLGYANGLNCTAKQLREVYRELFLGKRYRINVYGGFTMDCKAGTMTLLRQANFASAEKNAIPNPHIYYYACQGSFAQDYSEAFTNHDYVDVLTTALSEVSNVNWTDISPMEKFAADICCYYNNRPCVWDKQDKVFITPKELAERVKANG